MFLKTGYPYRQQAKKTSGATCMLINRIHKKYSTDNANMVNDAYTNLVGMSYSLMPAESVPLFAGKPAN